LISYDERLIIFAKIIVRGAYAYSSAAALLWLGVILLQGHEELLAGVHLISLVVLAGVLLWPCFFLIIVVVLVEPKLTVKKRLALLGGFLLLTSTFFVAYPAVKRITSIGIVMLHGADYWVTKAASAKTDNEALREIKIIIVAENKHGGAIACSSIVNKCSRADQERLLILLMSNPPVEEWRWYFTKFYKENVAQNDEKEQDRWHEP
jgi:hypothetical protein